MATLIRIGMITALAAFMTACASVPDREVTEALTRAETALEAAEATDADEDAPVLYQRQTAQRPRGGGRPGWHTRHLPGRKSRR